MLTPIRENCATCGTEMIYSVGSLPYCCVCRRNAASNASVSWQQEQRQDAIDTLAKDIFTQAMAKSIAHELCADNAITIREASVAAAELWFAKEGR